MTDLARRTGVAIRQQLRASERSIDEGLIAQSRIMAAMLEARLQLGLEAQAKRELVREGVSILSDLFRHRERVLDFHESQLQLAGEMGITPIMIGDAGNKASLKPAPEDGNVHRIAA